MPRDSLRENYVKNSVCITLSRPMQESKPVFVTFEGLEEFRHGGSKAARLRANWPVTSRTTTALKPILVWFLTCINKIAFHC